MQNLQNLLEQSNDLPSLPEIYIRVSELLEDDDSDAQKIGKAVQTDPSLTAKILKMVNSAFYGLPIQVTSIPQAVTLLGRQQLKQILMGSVLAGVFSDINIPNFPMRKFWEHSIQTAIIARHLALQNASIIDHEAFFTAGLLHDIGRLVIARVAPDELIEINDIVDAGGIDVILAEENQLGITHVDVGVALMQKWGMPGLLTQCIKHHHDSDHKGPFAIETSIVYLANQLSQKPLVQDEDEMPATLSTIANWQQTDNTPQQIFMACQLADEQWYEVIESLGMVDMEISDDFY